MSRPFSTPVYRRRQPISRESSYLISPRESSSVLKDWQRMQDTSTESERINDATSQLYRTFSKQTRPQQALSQLFPFAVYQFPLSLRHFIPSNYAQRFKVRGGALIPHLLNSEANAMQGTDLAFSPNAQTLLSPYTIESPPDDATLISPTWHEVVVPMDGNTYVFWASQCLSTESVTEGVVFGSINTSGLSMQSGNTVNDPWPTFPGNDPYHTVLATISGFPGTGYVINQYVRDNIIEFRTTPDNFGQGMNAMFWRGQYSATKFYYVGDVVQVGTIGSTNPLYQYIYWPTRGVSSWPLANGPINQTPGGGPAPTYPPTDPWVLWMAANQP